MTRFVCLSDVLHFIGGKYHLGCNSISVITRVAVHELWLAQKIDLTIHKSGQYPRMVSAK